MSKEKHIFSFDLIKTIAIWLVLFAHFCRLNVNFIVNEGIVYILNYAFKTLTVFAVPLFFMVNGALVFNRLEKYTFDTVIRKVVHFVFLRCFFSLLGTVISMYAEHTVYTFSQFIKCFISTPGYPYTFLWFIDALIGIYIFIPFLAVLWKDNVNNVKQLLLMLLVFTVIPYTFHQASLLFSHTLMGGVFIKSLLQLI